MTGKTRLKLLLMCPSCMKGEFSVEHIVAGMKFGPWCCDKCGAYCSGERVGATFELTINEEIKREKITVTLQSKTQPPITLRLNTWQYMPGGTAQELTPERAWDNARYYFNKHTCPTNYMNDVAEIIYDGSSDPHGVFEFVSIEFGHIGDKEHD